MIGCINFIANQIVNFLIPPGGRNFVSRFPAMPADVRSISGWPTWSR